MTPGQRQVRAASLIATEDCGETIQSAADLSHLTLELSFCPGPHLFEGKSTDRGTRTMGFCIDYRLRL